MICPNCGETVPARDRHCVYCGKSLGGISRRLPTWAKWLGGLGSICIIAVLAFYILLFNSTNGSSTNSTNGNNLEPPSDILVLLTPEQEDMPVPRPVIYSKYLSGVAPTIEGVLQAGEWTEPAFIKPFIYSIDGKEKSGDIAGYFMNDDEFLYAAITVSAEDFKEDYMDNNSGTRFSLSMYFDGENDDIITTGEDFKWIYIGQYQDGHSILDPNGGWSGQINEIQDGSGYATSSIESNTIVYELESPLDSGDADDISVNEGDTIGLLICFDQEWFIPDSYELRFIGRIGWPIAGWFDVASMYGKLVLAAGPY